MSTKFRIQLDYDALGKALFGSGTESILSNTARGIRSRCGDGYSYTVFRIGRRCVGRVTAVSRKAKRDNLKNNTLLKNMR